MKALKTGLLLSLAILLSVACATTETANQNANKAAPPANVSPSSTPAPAANNNQASGQTPSPVAPGGVAAVLYAEQGCATCHGRDGKPTLKQSPDLSDPAWQKKASDDQIFKAIKNGKPPLMQGYGSKLSDEQIRALVAHTRSFAKK